MIKKIKNFFIEEVEPEHDVVEDSGEETELNSEPAEEEKTESQETETKTKEEEKLPDCCKPQKKRSGLGSGILFGLLPHAGCIAFIIASVLGLTVMASLFRPLLMKSYFFYGMMALSLIFATISAYFYLRRFGGLKTARKHKGYLSILYGSTIGMTALLYFVIFPLVAVSAANSGNTGGNLASNLNTLTINVAIPCPGHAPLIIDELKKIDGFVKVEYTPSTTFKIYYNPTKTTKEKILSTPIFQDYKATVKGESSGVSTTALATASPSATTNTASGNVQVVKLSVSGLKYVLEPSTVKKGIPVRIEGDLANMPGCSKSVVISAFNVNKYLTSGDNTIEFTPDKAGTFNIACSMNMYKGTFEVLNSDGSSSNYVQPSSGSGGGCGCGGGSGGSCGG